MICFKIIKQCFQLYPSIFRFLGLGNIYSENVSKMFPSDVSKWVNKIKDLWAMFPKCFQSVFPTPQILYKCFHLSLS
jgi:hypothetical protein